jgi:hypothetical protein
MGSSQSKQREEIFVEILGLASMKPNRHLIGNDRNGELNHEC